MEIWEKLKAITDDFFAVRQQLQSTASTLPDPIFIIDEFGKYLEVIGGRKQSLFYSGKFLLGKHLRDVLPEDLAAQFLQVIDAALGDNSLKTFEYQLGPSDIRGPGRDVPKGRDWFEARIYPIKDKANEVHSVVVLAINITKRKNLEKQVKELAEKDDLTGASTRKQFMRIFDKEFLIAKRYQSHLSVLLIGIDKFKSINEEYGPDGGVALLKKFVIFTEGNLRRADLLACYAEGIFVVMLPNTPSLGAVVIAERIRNDSAEMSVPYGKQTIRFTISIGISSILDTDTQGSALLSRVDTALYLAKKKGSGCIEMS